MLPTVHCNSQCSTRSYTDKEFMVYTTTNFKTKKALIERFKGGTPISVYQPGGFAGKTDGDVAIEGPHYPEAHKWYAQATIVDGIITKVK